MSNIEFRRCTPEDVKQAVPLIYSAGPLAFDIAFSDTHNKQSEEFLTSAYTKPGNEFSFEQHLAITRNNELVGLGGVKTAKQTAKFTVKAAFAIFKFYSFFSACRTIIRGLKIETIIKPPKKRIAMIHNLAIVPNYRGEGLGSQLIEQLELQMLQQGYNTAALDVDGNNLKAKALYQKLGYEVKQERAGLVQGRFTKPIKMQSFYMEKKLTIK